MFLRNSQCEKYYLHKYGTFQELSKAIDEYIHFYNLDKLNDHSPMGYRTMAA
ncbi:IS3 family transposase [Virgibacillus halotolerans]|uniref:IS3 family transposase n=1 Tax=Virgibacillus halotolerans TaxID=1071053 RepID=UPI001961D48E